MRRERATHCACSLPGPGLPRSFSALVYGFFCNRCKCAESPVRCHDMKSGRPSQTFAAAMIFLLSVGLTHAHLGIVRWRQTQGPFAITVFTSPEVVRGRAADVSVMVQRRDSNEAILDADVSF